ncbi:MAG: metallophosphoesterase [Gammaproteobacteria bacterium]
MNKAFQLVQLTDTHLFSDPKQTKYDINHYQSFHKILAHIQQNTAPNLLLHTGDIVDDIEETAYEHAIKGLKKTNLDIAWMVGNHDDLTLAEHIFEKHNLPRQQHKILNETWQIILLNSHTPNMIGGHLSQEEFSHLENSLQTHPNHFTIVAVHHHPTPISHRSYDKIMLDNGDELIKKLQKYSKVKIVLFGHVHQELKQRIGDIDYLSCPSTCSQYKPKCETFIRDDMSAGYRVINLFDDGRYETKVVRI